MVELTTLRRNLCTSTLGLEHTLARGPGPYCCAQFAVSRETIQARSEDRIEAYADGRVEQLELVWR